MALRSLRPSRVAQSQEGRFPAAISGKPHSRRGKPREHCISAALPVGDRTRSALFLGLPSKNSAGKPVPQGRKVIRSLYACFIMPVPIGFLRVAPSCDFPGAPLVGSSASSTTTSTRPAPPRSSMPCKRLTRKTSRVARRHGSGVHPPLRQRDPRGVRMKFRCSIDPTFDGLHRRDFRSYF